MQIPYEDIQAVAARCCDPQMPRHIQEAANRVQDWLNAPEEQPQKREPVAPRAGQVWQKLNIGTKTAPKAPRITIDQVTGSLVFGWVGHEYKRMRITTLQRDWHCLNPEG